MKIRSDYVTNSSSSSYVIAYKTLPEIDEETLAKYPFLKNYRKLIEKALFTDDDYDTTVGTVSRTKEEYDDYFVSEYSWKNHVSLEEILKDNTYLVEIYNAAIEYLGKGFNILSKNIGYDNNYCINMIEQLAEDKENFIILYGE